MSDHPSITPQPETRDTPPSAESKLHLAGSSPSELRTWLVQEGQPRYRADQIIDWVFAKHASSFEQMTNLSKQLREWLAQRCDICRAAITREQASTDGTRKLLLTWPDGATTETVWIPDGQRHTACLSSQVGCAMQCRFCASGVGGFQRNLSAGEIVEQALHVQRLIRANGESGSDAERLTNIVIMGAGEPLANYAETMCAVRILNATWGLGIGARKITISTVGLPKQIRRLAEEDLQLNLALSLHAANDNLRRELIPRGHPSIAELLSACAYYFDRTGREITLEYVLLAGVNDDADQAQRLAQLAKRLRCNVNLLRYNPAEGLPYGRPSSATARDFQQRLRSLGVNAHIRRSRGADIDAACGQLRRRQRET